MSMLSALKYQLKNGENLDYTLEEVAKASESHYLGYFMTNLLLEIVTFFEIIHEDDQQNILEQEPEFMKLADHITSSLLDLDQWLNPSVEGVNARLTAMMAYRVMLSDQVATLAAYDDQLSMFEYMLVRRKNNVGRIKDDQRLTDELVQFMFEFEDIMTINDRIKSVYALLPVRMSHIKFQEWVEKALLGMKGVSVLDLKNYMTYLKETYDPQGVAGYGEVFVEFAQDLKSFEVLLTDIVNYDLIPALEIKMANMKKMLEACVSLYTYTASVVNNMIGLLSVLNEESLSEQAILKEEFVKNLRYILDRRSEVDLIDAYLVEEFNHISLSFDHVRQQNGAYDALIEEAKSSFVEMIVNNGLHDRYDRLSSLYVLQSNSYFAPLTIDHEGIVAIDEQTLIKMKNELLATFKSISDQDTRIQKRARIANLLAVLNVVHSSEEEIRNYCLSTLSSCKDERERLGCQMALESLMSIG